MSLSLDYIGLLFIGMGLGLGRHPLVICKKKHPKARKPPKKSKDVWYFILYHLCAQDRSQGLVFALQTGVKVS